MVFRSCRCWDAPALARLACSLSTIESLALQGRSLARCAGWARSAARGCRAAVRRRVTRQERATGHASGHNSVGLQGQRRHGCTCMPMPRGDDKTSQGSCQNTDRRPRMFGSEHQQSTKTSTSDFSTTTNPIETIQKPMCSKLSLFSYEPSSLVNIFKS